MLTQRCSLSHTDSKKDPLRQFEPTRCHGDIWSFRSTLQKRAVMRSARSLGSLASRIDLCIAAFSRAARAFTVPAQYKPGHKHHWHNKQKHDEPIRSHVHDRNYHRKTMCVPSNELNSTRVLPKLDYLFLFGCFVESSVNVLS